MNTNFTSTLFVPNKIQSVCSFVLQKACLIILLLNSSTISFGMPFQRVITYPAPQSAVLSHRYKVSIGSKVVDVYTVKVAAADNTRRFRAVDDLMHSADYFDTAAFCYFSVRRKSLISIGVNQDIHKVKVLPSSFGIKTIIKQHKILFEIQPGQNLTVEINNDIVHSLHIFADKIEPNPPKAGDKNVIYFGPGTHKITSMIIGDYKTVYIAGGAVIQAVVGNDEKFTTEPSGLKNYPPTFILAGRHIKFEGSGIIDASACTTHARNLLSIYKSHNVELNGIIIVNSSGWTVPIVQSDSVKINDIKILGYRANTDGIDICNSRNVMVDNCFIRTNDDLIVVKTWENQGVADHILITHCVLWNQLANALSLGAELRENVNDVVFANCDIIHDTGREWSLHIFQCDGSTISNIRFENINIEESRQFISIWIGKAGPSLNNSLGVINNVVFKNIKAFGNPLGMELIGGDSNHKINNILFTRVLINNNPVSKDNIRINSYVKNIVIK
jgi:hypothetical protein